jgi:hypothetical protein
MGLEAADDAKSALTHTRPSRHEQANIKAARRSPGGLEPLVNFALELISLSIDSCEIIVGEIAPLLLDLSLYLLPVSFNSIPIHFESPGVNASAM